MSLKNITININSASETVQSLRIAGGEGGAGAKGQGVRIKALANVKYHFTDEATGYGPENMATKRVGKNLHIAFEGGDVNQPDLVIEDYYKDNGEIGYGEGSDNLLVGTHENGNVYPYVPESAVSTDAVSMLADGVQAGQALGTSVAPVPLWWLPLLILPALGGGDGGTPPVPGPTADPKVAETLDDEGLEGGIPGAPDDSDVPGELTTTSGKLPFTAPAGLKSIVLNYAGTHLGSEEVTSSWDPATHTLTISSKDAARGDLMTILVDQGTGEYTITLLKPLMHVEEDVSTENDIVLELGYTVTDQQNRSVDSTLTVTVDDDVPQAHADTATQATEGAPIEIDALVNDEFGADGVDTDNAPNVVVTVLTQPAQGTVTYDAATGKFTYTPNAGAGSTSTTDSFTYQIEDGDGDKSSATVTITLQADSVPVVKTVNHATVDEDGLSNANVDASPLLDTETDSTESATDTKTLVVTYGNDVPADLLAAIKLSNAGLDTQLDALGGDVTWTLSTDGRMLTGSVGTTPVMTIAITGANVTNAATGEVTYTYEVELLQPVTHPGNDNEDTVTLSDIGFTVTDKDGDPVSGKFNVSVVDDVPQAHADTATQATEGAPIEIDALGNDEFGADGVDTDNAPKVVVTVLTQPAQGTVTYDAATGKFTYTPNAGAGSTSTTDSFTYQIEDGDGDKSSATVTITLQADSVPVVKTVNHATVDEDGLSNANVDASPLLDTETDSTESETDKKTLVVTYGNDVPADLLAAIKLSNAGLDTQLDALGGDVTWTLSTDGRTLTGSVGTTPVMTIAITGANVTDAATGEVTYTYEVELLQPVTHPGNDNEDTVTLSDIGFTVTDKDGDPVSGKFNVSVVDDVPQAHADTATQATEGAPIEIDALGNDEFGADGVDTDNAPKVVVTVLTQPAQGTVTYDAATGKFTYTPNAGAGSTSTTDSFTYQIEDGDGDKSSATVTITLQADSVPVVKTVNHATVDEDGLSNANVDASPLLDTETDSTESETDKKTLVVTYGNDVPADLLAAIKLSNAGLDTQLDALGGDVTWTLSTDGRTLTGSVGTTPVMTIAITGANVTDAATGEVTYTYEVELLQPVTHPGNDNEDTVTLSDIGFTVTDKDGDPVSGKFNVSVVDDVPQAHADTATQATEGAPIEIDALGNDEFGADGVDTDNAPKVVVTVLTQPAQGTVTYDAATGKFTYTPNAGAGSTSTTDSFTYQIEDGDGDKSSATVTITLQADSVPVVKTVNHATVDEDGLSNANVDASPLLDTETDSTESETDKKTLVVTYGNDVPADLLAAIKLSNAGLDTQLDALGGDVTWTLSTDGRTLTGSVGTTPVMTIAITGANVTDATTGEVTYTYVVTLLQPVTHPVNDNEDSVTLSDIGFTVTDKDGDPVSGKFNVSVVDDVPQAHADTATQATEGAPIEIDALVNDEFGADGVDTDNAPKVVVTVLTQPAQGTVTYDAATGKFTYTPNAGAGSTSTTDSFTYQIEDGDGDKSSATVTITLQADSVPVVKTVNHATVDEDGLSNANVDASPLLDTETDSTESETDKKTLVVTYGNDVPADLLAAIKLSNAGLDTQLDALGGDVTWTLSTDGRTLTGSVGTTPVMTIAITGANVTDAATGEVTYTYEVELLQPVTHPGNDNEDTVTLSDIGFTVTDKDGDPVSGKFNVSVVDDVPQAHADTATQATEGAPIEIDALGNDEFGADGVDTDNAPKVVVTVLTQPAQGTVTYDAATGKFTYTPNAGAGSTSTTDSFTYQIEDGDGDKSSATVTITLQADSVPVVKTVNHATVDEDGLSNANVDASPLLDTETDSTESETDKKTLVVTYGNDVPADLLAAIKLSNAGLDTQLDALGGDVTWTLSTDGRTLTGSVGTTPVMTIAITGANVTDAATGEVTYTYEVELLQPVTHPGNDNEDTVTLSDIGFTVTDKDGDPVSGKFNVSVVDDVPQAHADTATQATEGAPIEIDALGNDEFGADGVDTDNAPKVVVTVLTQPAQGTVTYDAATGKFTYTPNAGAGSTSTTDSFTYQIEDGDGDKSSATVTITLQADSVPVVKTVNHATVDEDGLSNANVDASPLLDTETDSTESETDKKTLVVTYGNDVPADLLAAIKLSNAGLDTQLDALGGDVTWTLSTDGRTLTGSVGTTPVMTIAITGANVTDATTGEVTYTYVVTLLQPVTHPGNDNEDTVTLSDIGFTVTDKDGDPVSGKFNVSVVDDVPQAHADTATQATEGAPIEIDALGNDEFGADGVDTDNAPKVVVTVLTQPAQGTVTYDAATGKFTYTPNAGAGSTSTTDSFTYQIEDGDGDKSSATVTITLQADSVPVVKTVNHATVDEDGLSNANVDASPLLDTETDSTESETDKKTLVVTYGNDVPADLLAAIKLSNAGLDTQLDALGGDVTWTLSTDGRTLTGSVGTTPVMTIAITGANVTDAATGEVTYTYEVELLQPVTHPGNDNEDTVTLSDIGFTVTDKDGDPVSGKFNVSVVDDVPQAHADTATQATEGAPIEIDALGNDEFGADGVDTDNAPKVVVTVLTQPAQGTVTYDAATGKFTYTPNAGAGSTSTTDSFTYQIEDGDGDKSSATVTITLQADSVPVVKTVNHATVDEDGLSNANVDASPLLDTETDSTESETDKKTLVVTYGNDVPADLLAAIKLSNAGLDTQLDALGGDVTWTLSTDGRTLTGSVGTTPVMTIAITGANVTDAATGEVTYTYEVELLQPVTHPGNDNEDTVTLSDIGFTVTDKDGDPVSGKFNVSVVDDVPQAHADTATQATEGAPIEIDALVNDEFGADGVDTDNAPKVVVTVLTQPAQGTVTYDAATGKFTYTPNAGAGSTSTTDSFTYQIEDGDGDKSSATVTITLQADSVPVVKTVNHATVDEDGLSNANVDASPLLDTETDSTESETDKKTLVVTYGNDVPADLLAAIKLSNAGLDTQLDALGGDVTWTLSTDGRTLTGSVGTTPVMTIAITGANVTNAATGEVTYTYEVELLQPVTHPGNDNEDTVTLSDIGFTVTDKDGDPVSGKFNVSVVDDVPQAHADTATQATEGAPIEIDALGNDEFGADGVDTDNAPKVVVTVLTQPAQGTVTYDAATGKFTYTPNAGAGSTSTTDSFTYQIEDGDGDKSSATVTITLQADSVPVVKTVNHATVDEDGLSNANVDASPLLDTETDSTESETDKKTLVVTYGNDVPADLLAAIKLSNAGLDTQLDALGGDVTWTLSTDGRTLTGSVGTTQVMTIAIKGASVTDAATGAVTYTYEVKLLQPVTHPGNDKEDTVTLSDIGFTVTDKDGDPVSGKFNVSVVDDVPSGKSVDASTQVLDDDAQPDGNPGATNGDVPNLTVVQGNAGSLFSAGADGVKSIELSAAQGDAAMWAIHVDTTAGRKATPYLIDWEPSGNLAQDGYVLLTGSITVGTTKITVAKLTVNADGSYKYEQLAPVVSSKPTGDGVEETDAFSFTIKVTDGDGDWATGSLKVHVNDDTPVDAEVADVTISNKLMGSHTFTLDATDKAFALNYGADGGTVKFNVTTGQEAKDATGATMTAGGATIHYVVSADGKTLQGVTGYDAATGNFDKTVFNVTLNPEASAYTVEMLQPVDVTIDVNYAATGYAFKGGQGDWNGYYNLALTDSKDLLLTAEPSGDVNTATGVGGVHNPYMNGTETMRIDYVVDLEPVGNANKDFGFQKYYVAQGAGFSLVPKDAGNAGDVAIALRAYNVTGGGQNATGTPTQEPITGIVITNNGTTSKFITPTTQLKTYTVGTDTYQVILKADGTVEVSDIDSPTSISVFTADGYNSLQVQNVNTSKEFQFTKFVSTELTEQDLSFDLPLQLVDGDGDTAASSLGITLSGKSAPPVWGTEAMAAATVSEEGLPAGIPDGVPSDSASAAVAAGSVKFTDSDSALADLSFQFTSPVGSYTSGGKQVYWDRNVEGVITGYTATVDANGDLVNRENVIKVKMGSIEQVGTEFQAGYTVDLYKPLDHVKTGQGTSMPIDFGLKVYDGRSYSDAKVLTVHVQDDTPATAGIRHEVAVGVDSLVVNNLQAGFIGYVLDNGNQVPFGNRFDNDADDYIDKVQWGGWSGYSSYSLVDNPAFVGTGSAAPLGEIFKLGDFTHVNNPISGAALDYVTVELKFDVIVNGTTHTLTGKFKLDHTETPNNGPHPDDIIKIEPVSGSGGTVLPDGSLKFVLDNAAGEGQYALVIKGFRDAAGNYVQEVNSKENSTNTFQIYAVVEAEHEVGPVSSNIFANGGLLPGADNMPLSDVQWAAHTSQWGTFTGQADGSYTFKLSDYGQLNVGIGGSRTETVSYNYLDADGDKVTGTVEIVLEGYKNWEGAVNPASTQPLYLQGTGGADALAGGAAADYLVGGAGNDTLTGNGGADRFVFNAALGSGNVDTITDFGNGADKLVLASDVFAGLVAGGAVHLEFGGANAATEAGKPTVLYDKASGNLYFDADGQGGNAAVQFAVLSNKPQDLAPSQFIVI